MFLEKNKAEETCRETSRIRLILKERLGGREIKKGKKMERERKRMRET